MYRLRPVVCSAPIAAPRTIDNATMNVTVARICVSSTRDYRRTFSRCLAGAIILARIADSGKSAGDRRLDER
jgi:hypothetical protein